MFHVKQAAFYCVKYVTKSAFLKPKFSKLYTKSVGVAFFPAKDKLGIWAIYNRKTGEWHWPVPDEPLLECSTAHLHGENTQILLFDLQNPPPPIDEGIGY
jgi:hypothetical protein